MNIEEKAKRYDEAVKRVENIKTGKCKTKFVFTEGLFEYIFPELKESEERTKYEIIAFIEQAIHRGGGTPIPQEQENKWISWLEKQGEQKVANSYCQENCKGFKETRKCFADGDCKAKREAESIDKVEPKFHEGDWVVYKNDICQIVKREEGCNKLVTVFGIEKELVNERNLSTARLWNIEDAKDGDVLVMQKTNVTYESIFIFKKIENNRIIQYLHYFTTDADEEVCEARSIDGFLGFVGTNVHPATKEQRDTLFAKMKEAGYEWDAEKKELKRIEQKKTPIEGEFPYDNPSGTLEGEIENIWGKLSSGGRFSANKEGFHEVITHFVSYIKDRVQSQPKQQWSEEDNELLAK